MGFTAINSSSPAEQPHIFPSNGARACAVEHTTSSAKHATVAAADLGRGDAIEAVVSGKSSSKRIANKSKKRATTAPSQQSAKRRKTGNVCGVMPATKRRNAAKEWSAAEANVNGTKPVKEAAPQHEQPSTPAKKSSKTSLRSVQEAVGEADSTSASSAVSVIVPATSMSVLQGTAYQTSFDAVKSSFGHGAALYNSSSSPTKHTDRLQVSRPLLDRNRSPTKPLLSNTPDFPDVDNAGNIVQSTDPSPDSDDDFDALFDELAQQIDSGPTQNKTPANTDARRDTRSPAGDAQPKVTAQARDQRADDEEFPRDDDDLTEATTLADSVTKVPAASTRNIKSSARTKLAQLPTPAKSDATNRASHHAKTDSSNNSKDAEDCAIMIHCDDEDEGMIELEKAIKEFEKKGLKPRLRKQNMHIVDVREDYGGALLDDAEKQLLDKLRSTGQHADRKPIVRSSFPRPVPDRSPVFGTSNTTVLRTCFRLGEALNVGSRAVRNNQTVMLEIYARVACSSRDGRKQHFVFRDLYHDRAPHLEGSFELWSQSRLWDLDSQAFLKAEEKPRGIMCRVVAKMKRDGTKWRLEVLSIRAAGWEDVDAVAGIYAKEGCR